jgi:hypothetical protein
MGFLEALNFLKAKRPGVCPNLGFELQLKAYEKSHASAARTFILLTKKKARKELP